MVELYQDTLVDLLLPRSSKRLKLEIKKDSKVNLYIILHTNDSLFFPGFNVAFISSVCTSFLLRLFLGNGIY